MGIAYHTSYAVDGCGLNAANRVYLGSVTATYAAAAPGVASTVAVTWTEPVPISYTALMSPTEDCTYFISAKTTVSLTLNVLPRLAANSLVGGTVEILIIS